ncbi:MAG: hypothetical protein ACXVBT_07325 [Flavisolibacter sp.]
MKKTIALIGLKEKTGLALAEKLAGSSCRLLLYVPDRNFLSGILDRTRREGTVAEIDVLDCPMEAGWEADMIILALSPAEKKEVALRIRPVVTQKIILDLVNPWMEGYLSLPTAVQHNDTHELEQWLPDAKIVTARFAHDPFEDREKGERKVYLEGKDEEALATVRNLMDVAGW